ncbi:MAG: flagellar basal body-associated FliL family protein [Ignavibacteria bacterium]|nr:flagellar basal body-associated FliL family protein [Ignavibacteria bacterium]
MKSSSTIIIILLLIIIGGGGWYLYSSKNKTASTEEIDGGSGDGVSSKKVAVEKTKVETLEIKEKFLINITSASGSTYILKTEVSVEVSNKKSAGELALRQAKIADILNTVLRSKTYEELNNDFPKLKEELREKFDALVTEGKVLDVLFKTFVFQPLK